MKLAILMLFLACASIAGGAKAASFDGRWAYTFPCDSRPGLGDERCAAGENDEFQLTVVERGNRLCGEYMLTTGFGNHVDEADVDWPLERDAHGEAHVKFRLQGGGGEAVLDVEDNQMSWRIVGARHDPQLAFWAPPPKLAVLTRLDEVTPASGHTKCGAASVMRPKATPAQPPSSQVTQGDVRTLIGLMGALADSPRFVPPGWLWTSPAEEQAHGVCADRLGDASQLAFAYVSTLTRASLILVDMTSAHDRAVARIQATSTAGASLDALARERGRVQSIADDCSRFDDVKSSAQTLSASLNRAIGAIHPIAVKLDAALPTPQSDATRVP